MAQADGNSRLRSDGSDDEQEMEVYESLNAPDEPTHEALRKLAAAAAEESEYMDDELIHQDDPYLQDLLAPLADD